MAVWLSVGLAGWLAGCISHPYLIFWLDLCQWTEPGAALVKFLRLFFKIWPGHLPNKIDAPGKLSLDNLGLAGILKNSRVNTSIGYKPLETSTSTPWQLRERHSEGTARDNFGQATTPQNTKKGGDAFGRQPAPLPTTSHTTPEVITFPGEGVRCGRNVRRLPRNRAHIRAPSWGVRLIKVPPSSQLLVWDYGRSRRSNCPSTVPRCVQSLRGPLPSARARTALWKKREIHGRERRSHLHTTHWRHRGWETFFCVMRLKKKAPDFE